ncbi:MAG: hypothetical protein ACXVZO_11015 [Gaiellaceae bacterium]
MSRGGLLAIAIALAALAAPSAQATPVGPAATSYRGHGVSFRYPSDWQLLKPGNLSAQRGSQLWTTWLGPAANGHDLVMFSAYHTTVAITAKNAALYSGQVASAISTLARQAGGKILAGPKLTNMGGLPGYDFRISAKAPGGKAVQSRLVLVWRRKTEFFLNCQHEVGGSRTAKIEQGCSAVIGSFKAG